MPNSPPHTHQSSSSDTETSASSQHSSPPRTSGRYSPQQIAADDVHYLISPEDIMQGREHRTTVMIRNIPNKYYLVSLSQFSSVFSRSSDPPEMHSLTGKAPGYLQCFQQGPLRCCKKRHFRSFVDQNRNQLSYLLALPPHGLQDVSTPCMLSIMLYFLSLASFSTFLYLSLSSGVVMGEKPESRLLFRVVFKKKKIIIIIIIIKQQKEQPWLRLRQHNRARVSHLSLLTSTNVVKEPEGTITFHLSHFITSFVIGLFEAMQGKLWPQSQSSKICQLSFAKYQGKEALLKLYSVKTK